MEVNSILKMDILIYSSVLFASFLGLFIGILISNMAVEEIIVSAKYLKYLNILLISIVVFLSSFRSNLIYSIIFSSILFLSLILFRNKYNDAWTYSCLGAIFYLSTKNNMTLEVAILILIYGINIATIEAANSLKKPDNKLKWSKNVYLIKRILSNYSYFLLFGILFYFIFNL